ncbi:Recombinase [Ruminococcus sp. YE71]|uniref:recombinase family protein n=1 Tax=unclassified Ruminococcus TaxID=2608920 RepID=UPI000888694E|nr:MULTISPECIES: recombinase family protein [unclassified Ruminococcus]SDA29543.1 Recombinase [Ruminococcus sp. YE78]SFW48457.1 Recombinase [Ruminococcus sp. YE71]
MIHKRKIPYGYMMRRGQTVINENEAQIVRTIFELSASGISGGEILQQLDAGNDDYWKDEKNKLIDKVHGILRKEYYCGSDDLPAIITKELFDKARESTRKRDHFHSSNQTKVPIKYVCCAVCGNPFFRGRNTGDLRWKCKNPDCINRVDGIKESDLYYQLTAILQRVQADNSLLDIEPKPIRYEPTVEVRNGENEVLMRCHVKPIDEERIRREIIELASLKYDCISYSMAPARTAELKELLNGMKPIDSIDTKLIRATMKRVLISGDQTVTTEFINGKKIHYEKEKDHEHQ